MGKNSYMSNSYEVGLVFNNLEIEENIKISNVEIWSLMNKEAAE